MSALEFAPPEPRVLRVSTRTCDGPCGGMGYLDDSSPCDECGGTGELTIEIVECPVHGAAVARAKSGELLGVCDGCAAENARGLQFFAQRALDLLSDHSTGRARLVGVTGAGAARQETS